MVRMWFLFVVMVRVARSLPTVEVDGAGATFPSTVYKTWIPDYRSYRSHHVSLSMTYDAIGSGGGQSRIKGINGPPVAYAGSDSLLTADDYVEYPALQMLPTMAGAVVMGYNLKDITNLNLTREVVLGIYNGTIRWWNDSLIQEVNTVQLPDRRIIILARSDKSGTTDLFTTALSAFSEEWRETYGTFSHGLDAHDNPTYWDPEVISFFGFGNHAVSAFLLSLRDSIGYMSMAMAKTDEVPYATLENSQGNLILPTVESIQSAMSDFANRQPNDTRTSPSDGAGNNSYPMVGYTYFIIWMEMENCDQAVELYRYIEWFLYNDVPRYVCVENGMVPLHVSVAEDNMGIIAEMACDGGRSVYDLVEAQKEAEADTGNPWLVYVYISIACVFPVLIGVSSFCIQERWREYRSLARKEWLIPGSEVVELHAAGNARKSLLSMRSTSTRSHCSQHDGDIVVMWRGQKLIRSAYAIPLKTKISIRTQRGLLWCRSSVRHQNVLQFYGVITQKPVYYSLSAYCTKGTLENFLYTTEFDFTTNIKTILAQDLAAGMEYLHSVDIVHGSISLSSCFIDSKWTVKLGDWLPGYLRFEQETTTAVLNPYVTTTDETDRWFQTRKFYLSPEVILGLDKHPMRQDDVYSFGVAMCEIFTMTPPFSAELETHTPEEIVELLAGRRLRPSAEANLSPAVVRIMQSCWLETPHERPSGGKLRRLIAKTKPSSRTIIDCMMTALDGLVTKLEDRVEERTVELKNAMESFQTLLHQILPPSVADRLSTGQSVEPENFDSVTIYFSDIVGFTSLSSASTPFEIVTMLNDLYTTFDGVVDQHDVYKVETIGDAYMVISGLPTRNGQQHVCHIANMALDLIQKATYFRICHRPSEQLKLRVGIHSGPVVAGVVGKKMPRYCLFGDAVNMASRMESTSLAMRIQISEATNDLLQLAGGFRTQPRGEIEIKGKGVQMTYWLISREDQPG